MCWPGITGAGPGSGGGNTDALIGMCWLGGGADASGEANVKEGLGQLWRESAGIGLKATEWRRRNGCRPRRKRNV